MQLHLEQHNRYAVTGYSTHEIKINNIIYTDSFIATPQGIHESWDAKLLEDLVPQDFSLLLPDSSVSPHLEILIIGHNQPNQLIKAFLLQYFAQQKIAVEAMSIGAACRTYNVLLSEKRPAALAILFKG